MSIQAVTIVCLGPVTHWGVAPKGAKWPVACARCEHDAAPPFWFPPKVRTGMWKQNRAQKKGKG